MLYFDENATDMEFKSSDFCNTTVFDPVYDLFYFDNSVKYVLTALLKVLRSVERLNRTRYLRLPDGGTERSQMEEFS